MRDNNIEILFNREFIISQRGTIENKLSATNKDHLECIRKIELAFVRIYEYGVPCFNIQPGGVPGTLRKGRFYDEFLRNPLLTRQMVGRVFSIVAPYKMNSGDNWRWRHPMDISKGCQELIKAIEKWDERTRHVN